MDFLEFRKGLYGIRKNLVKDGVGVRKGLYGWTRGDGTCGAGRCSVVS
jgi:hypothetical protein